MSAIVDVNVTLGQWPLRRLPLDEPRALVKRLRENRVAQAWCGHFDALLHKDVAAVNARLAEACAEFRDGLLLPFGTVNPSLPHWEDDLRRCAEEHRMPGIRLHPNYHGYTLDSPLFGALLARAAERRLLVQLCVQMEDERMMHPLLRVPPVDLAPLAKVLAHHPGARILLLNAMKATPGGALAECLALPNAWTDIAMLEGVGGLEKTLATTPAEKLLFGSHAPLFYHEAALLKFQESHLDPAQEAALRHKNAARLLG